MVATDHLGNQFKSITKMCEHYHINMKTYTQRIEHGWSIEDALTTKPGYCGSKIVKDHLGNEYQSIAALCRKYDISQNTYNRRITAGWSLKETLLTKVGIGGSEEIADHTGQIFPSTKAMCNHWHIPYSTYQNRVLKLNMTISEALTTPVNTQNTVGKTCKDHLGKEYQSIATMCCAYGIPRNVYHRRLKDGWNLEKALTTPVSRKNGQGRTIYDHKGNAYTSVGEMCNNYGIDFAMYGSRIRQGWSLKKALETPPEEVKIGKKECIDHKGNHFKSQAEMMRFWGVTKDQLRSRIELGWTLQQILEAPEHQSHKHPCVDHLGNHWDSQEEMLAHYGVNNTIFKRRLNVMGLSLEEALSSKSLHEVKCEDGIGHNYDTLKDMLNDWQCSTGNYHHHRNKFKRSVITSLIRPKKNMQIGRYTLVKDLGDDYWEVSTKNSKHNTVMSMYKLGKTYYRSIHHRKQTV